MVEELDERYEKALEKRKALQSHVQRLQGRHEAAEQAHEQAKKACRDKKIDPDNLDNLIAQVVERYEQLVVQVEKQNAEVEESIQPFLNQ